MSLNLYGVHLLMALTPHCLESMNLSNLINCHETQAFDQVAKKIGALIICEDVHDFWLHNSLKFLTFWSKL